MDWLNPQDDDIDENAMIMADSIITQKGRMDPFWDEEAKSLLVGFLMYVATDETERDKTLSRVRDIISMSEETRQSIWASMKASDYPIIRSAAARTLSKDEKLRAGVIATLQAHTHFLDSRRIRQSLAFSDFRFEDLKTKKMTIYLVLPADRLETFGRWLRLLIQQALTVNARNIHIKVEEPILFLLDEMPALGKLSMVSQAFGLMAGFGMQLWGIVQDLSQLEQIYEKGWETFIGNSGVLQYFGSRDCKTAEYFSKLCGVTTIPKMSLSRSIANAFGWSSSYTSGQQGGSSTSGSSSGETDTSGATFDVVQRQLAFPDELMVLKGHKQLLIIENNDPIPAIKMKWFEEERLKGLGVNLREKVKIPDARMVRVKEYFEKMGGTVATFPDGKIKVDWKGLSREFNTIDEAVEFVKKRIVEEKQASAQN